MRRLAPLSLLALAAVAVAQGFRTRPDNVVVRPDDVANTYHLGPYNATTGALFDAGYTTNSMGVSAYPPSVEGTDALIAAECEARMVRSGVNNALSNIFSLEDDASGRRVAAVAMMAVTLDAGVVISSGQAANATLFWRPLAGGDAGMPWFRAPGITPQLVGQQAATTPTNGKLLAVFQVPNSIAASNGVTGDEWAPGYYCLLPVNSPGAFSIGQIWVRINRVFEPK